MVRLPPLNRYSGPNGLVVLEVPLDPGLVVPQLPAAVFALRSASEVGQQYQTFDTANDLLTTYEAAWSHVDQANWESECFWEFVGLGSNITPTAIGELIIRALMRFFRDEGEGLQWFAFTMDDPYFRVYFNRRTIDDGPLLSMVQARGSEIAERPYSKLRPQWTVETLLAEGLRSWREPGPSAD